MAAFVICTNSLYLTVCPYVSCNGRVGDAFYISRILIQFNYVKCVFCYSELSGSMSHVYSFCTYIFFFRYTNIPLFGLQACVGNYQIITNTNVIEL